MKQLKKDLKVVNKGLKALIRKTESIEKKIAKLEKPSPKKRKARVKARATKKAVTKKAKKISIPETVFGAMKRSKKGLPWYNMICSPIDVNIPGDREG